jgi:hypothetical protein
LDDFDEFVEKLGKRVESGLSDAALRAVVEDGHRNLLAVPDSPRWDIWQYAFDLVCFLRRTATNDFDIALANHIELLYGN